MVENTGGGHGQKLSKFNGGGPLSSKPSAPLMKKITWRVDLSQIS